MMGALLFVIGALAQVLVGLWAVLGALRERSALLKWVEASVDPDASKEAAKALPEPHRRVASQMAESVRVRSTMDDALVKAVVRAADETWTPPFVVQAALHGLTILLALGPAVWALLRAATALNSSQARMTALPEATRYLEGPALLEGPFEALRAGFGESAMLLATLALVWSVAWWLRRPVAREARLVEALLRVATRIRPGTAAPIGGRLAALVAPERGLARPIAAAGLWVGAVTMAWGILYVTAEVRRDNHTEASYAVWPTEGRAPINVGAGLFPPRYRAGRPFQDRGVPTVTVGPMQVLFQGRPIADLQDGELATALPEPDARIVELLETQGAVTMLAHDNISATDGLLPVMTWLHRLGVKRFHLLVIRELEDGPAQADLQIRLSDDATEAGLTLDVGADDVSVGAARIPSARAAWRTEVGAAVQRIDALFSPDAPKPVRVVMREDVSYARLAEALSAADGTCPGRRDCGLPGLGLDFVIQP